MFFSYFRKAYFMLDQIFCKLRNILTIVTDPFHIGSYLKKTCRFFVFLLTDTKRGDLNRITSNSGAKAVNLILFFFDTHNMVVIHAKQHFF